ncbi:hypothetical protein [Paracoccus rhizosphaerae]|uniref:Uncharacterized protein n=1 Tax=Paracoccus rhizosphaerae TaxID=1133347 RepID=A0ABV6CE62_9RHOB|nr:hypothetical protein [Paracoccus rhizosphaerae]
MPGFLNALSDAGRKLSMQFPDEEAPRKGEALRAKVDAITQGVRQGQEREKNLAALLGVRVHVLDVLAKARRIATEVERALLEATSQSEAGFERLDGLGPYEVARNADDFGKRLVGASKKVIHSQRPSAYVQQTNDTDDRLSVSELAVVAMLCDIDPFLITAQHVLLHDELIAMRQVGRAFRSEQFNRTYLLHLETLRREYSGDTPLGQQEILQVYLGFPEHLMFEARG